MSKIVTCCAQGLVRSVGLADVLKLHFRPVDVIPIGLSSNSTETKEMLFAWTDWIVVMDEKYLKKVDSKWSSKLLCCNVGQDVFGNSHHPVLIDFVWRWCRSNAKVLGIEEHYERI